MDTEQQELLRLVRENNRMLHAMRRNAFLGGLLKLIVYAVLVLAPIWYYMTYLAPVMQQALSAMQQVQSAGGSAGSQYSELQAAFKKLQEQMSAFTGKQ
jgi:hypothetical protein